MSSDGQSCQQDMRSAKRSMAMDILSTVTIGNYHAVKVSTPAGGTGLADTDALDVAFDLLLPAVNAGE